MKKIEDFPPRVVFNWGYHDGASSIDMRTPFWTPESIQSHPNKVYSAGWKAGYEDKAHGVYAENSDQAWSRHQERSIA